MKRLKRCLEIAGLNHKINFSCLAWRQYFAVNVYVCNNEKLVKILKCSGQQFLRKWINFIDLQAIIHNFMKLLYFAKIIKQKILGNLIR